MDEGQLSFPFHLSLYPCCIDFQTGDGFSLVPPDSTSVSIRALLMCCCIWQSKRGALLFSTISHIVNMSECVVLFLVCTVWFAESLNPPTFHVHLNHRTCFSHSLPIVEHCKPSHIPASDKVRSCTMIFTMCWQPAESEKSILIVCQDLIPDAFQRPTPSSGWCTPYNVRKTLVGFHKP